MIIEDKLTMMLNAPNFCSGVVPLFKCNLQAGLGGGWQMEIHTRHQ
jgi:hypothetical protein